MEIMPDCALHLADQFMHDMITFNKASKKQKKENMVKSSERDEQKADSNIKKYGVTFKTASKAFLDENRIGIYDEAHSIDEDCFITIGLVEEILFVVYSVRHPKIRLISARLAPPKERSLYYGNV